MNCWRSNSESNTTPRFLADSEGTMMESPIRTLNSRTLETKFRFPMSNSSVLLSFNFSKLKNVLRNWPSYFLSHQHVIWKRKLRSKSKQVQSSFKMAEIISQNNGLTDAVAAAADVVLGGGVIAVPTDTIYGIAGLAQHATVIGRIYDIKKREVGKPLAICLADVQDLYKWCDVSVSSGLLHELLPGPVTLIFQRSAALNAALNPSTPHIGIRIPDNDFIRHLVRAVGGPLALTSANFSSEPSTLSIEEFRGLWPLLDAVVDGGKLRDSPLSRLGSTVVNLVTKGQYSIVRTGSAFHETVKILQSYGLQECRIE